jgi:hypothetical protein
MNGSGGIRTLSISRSKREWSAGCLPSQNAIPGAGIEPAASTFRAWRHYQQQLPRSRRFGKEDSNLHRLIQSQVACQLADSRERPAGVEPACRTWEARALLLGPGRYANRLIPDTRFPNRSGIGDSNPGRLVGSQESCRWTNPARRQIQERKERELNPQGSSLARVRIECRRQSACPSVIAIDYRAKDMHTTLKHRREESNLQSSP